MVYPLLFIESIEYEWFDQMVAQDVRQLVAIMVKNGLLLLIHLS